MRHGNGVHKNCLGIMKHMGVAALLLCRCFLSNPEEPEEQTGITDFAGVDGVTIQRSTSGDVRDKLGEPELTNETSVSLFYYYPARGLKFNIDRASDKVAAAYIYGDGWGYNVDGVTGAYEKYEHTTETGIGLNDSTATMDDVVNAYGIPEEKGLRDPNDTTGASPWYYEYTKIVGGRIGAMQFYFFAPDSNEYMDKEITQIILY